MNRKVELSDALQEIDKDGSKRRDTMIKRIVDKLKKEGWFLLEKLQKELQEQI